MTSSITRSSRSSVKKVTAPTIDNVIKPKSSTQIKKKKQIQRIRKDADLENRSYQQQQQQEQHQQQSQNNESLSSSKIDASEHPEYIRLMSQLDQSKNERLQKVENWRKFERQSIHDWFAAQKKQAWDDFYFAKRKVRSDLVQDVQRKIQKLEQELSLLNKQTRVQLPESQQECDYQDWVPPERLYAIGSFVGGASNDEIDRDLVYARQPYNGNNTPNLVYSDYESRSTTDTAEDVEVVSPSRTEIASSSSPTSTINDNYTTNQYQPPIFEQPNNQQVEQPSSSTNIYPPFEFDEMPQDGRRDWWPYRSTTTA
ncbi:hypothetical protein BDF21DRAFT_431142 [Thamnidium elegans]|nr:hypothetical protein BDF21DRAFT_431142 [Thamnidium elegans]